MSKIMPKFSWLHFSDLHFMSNEGVGANDARQKMYSELKKIKDIDYVFISGDVAHKGDYSGVKEHLLDLEPMFSNA